MGRGPRAPNDEERSVNPKMPGSRRPGLSGTDPLAPRPRTPGTLGVGDAGDPALRLGGLVGDTPGLVGFNDWAEPSVLFASAAAAAPFAAPPPQTEKTFSEHAEKRMWDLLKDYGSQVGSQRAAYLRRNGLPDDTRGKTPTDCITYVIDVLKYAFTQTGQQAVARKVGGLGTYGTALAAYLTTVRWNAHYWNPDVNNPPDNDREHPFSYALALKTRKYYGIPLSGYIVDYRPTEVAPPKKKTARDGAAFDEFKKVKFAYGLARGGRHTFLCSYGMVYEVHWEEIGDKLYERSDFYNFVWNSGVVVTPPDATFTSGKR